MRAQSEFTQAEIGMQDVIRARGKDKARHCISIFPITFISYGETPTQF